MPEKLYDGNDVIFNIKHSIIFKTSLIQEHASELTEIWYNCSPKLLYKIFIYEHHEVNILKIEFLLMFAMKFYSIAFSILQK